MEFLKRVVDVLFFNEVNPETFAPKVVFEVVGIPIKSSVTTTWIIIAFLAIISWLATRDLKEKPKATSLQNIVEMFIETIQGLVRDTMGAGMKKFVPYIGTLLLYLLIANLVGILPGRDLFNLYTPTADLNTTFALAFITFINIHYFGVKEKGIATYLKGYFEPMFFLFPLNVIGNLADPVSLSFRLFGNMIGGIVIMGLMFNVVAIAIPGIASLYFDVFAGLLQAFIFTMLTMTYISVGMD